MLRMSSSTTSTLRSCSGSSDWCSVSIMRCLAGGRSVITRCRNSAVSSSSRSGERTPFSTMLFALCRSSSSSAVDNSRPVNTTIGVSRSRSSCWMLSISSKPDTSGSRRSSTMQSNDFSLQRCERVGAAADRSDLHVVEADQLGDAHLLGRVVFDDQQLANARRSEVLDALERRFQSFGRRRLVHERERAALQAVLTLFFDREDLHRDVAGGGVALQLVEHRPAEHVRQEHVERDRRRPMLAREAQAFRAGLRDDRLELRVARQVQQHLGVVRIVFDDQQHTIVGLQVFAVVERAPRRAPRAARSAGTSASLPCGRTCAGLCRYAEPR